MKGHGQRKNETEGRRLKVRGGRLIIAFLCVLTAVLFSAASGTARAAGNDRMLTLMVYMCGSNLESEGGAATADMNEMIAATEGGSKITLLVMTGGAKRWANGYDADRLRIFEIRNGRHRELTSMEQADMGEGRTLTSFLRFGAERFPAENYALILWDHGGGPLEGVCWDELFAMNHMPLPELGDAIASAGLGKKLSWIGFDACLMSSMEVAVGLADTAEYMIASEEKEPATGWNYSFLRGMTGEEPAGEIGRKIVDAYFEGQEESGQTLTLACTNLAEAAEAAGKLGDYFEDLRSEITEESFPQFSGARLDATAFGLGVTGTEEEDNGYDLVDAGSLIQGMTQNPEGRTELEKQLGEAVVYSRSNREGATGLTLYYPLGNKKQYQSAWKDDYRRMSLIPGYSAFIQSFGTILTGEKLFHWRDLATQSAGVDEAGKYVFRLELTEEQRANFASAQLIILRDNWSGDRLDQAVNVISVAPAELDENGVLTGRYDGSALYAESAGEGLIGPLSVLPAEGGRTEAVAAVYVPENDYSLGRNQTVLYYLDPKDPSETPVPLRTEVLDEATEHFTGRLAFSEDPYRMVMFWNRNRAYPEEKDGVLPDCFQWESGTVISHMSLPLPDQWRFVRKKEQVTGNQLYALFRVTDSQQNTVCSIPAPVRNPNLIPFTASLSEGSEEAGAGLKLEGRVSLAEPQSVKLTLEAENRGEATVSFSGRELLLNGTRETSAYFFGTDTEPGQISVLECRIGLEELTDLKEIRTVSFLLRQTDPEGGEKTETVSFDLTGCDLSGLHFPEPLGESSSEKVRAKVLEIKPNAIYGFDLTLLMENDGENAIQPDGLTVNGFQLKDPLLQTVGAGHSRVFRIWWANGLVEESTALAVPGMEDGYYDTRVLRNLLGLHGQKSIREICVFWTEEGDAAEKQHQLTAELANPWPLQEQEKVGAWLEVTQILDPEEAGQDTELIPLMTNDRYRILLRRVLFGKMDLMILLEVSNLTENTLQLTADEITVNGGEVSLSPPLEMMFSGMPILPGSTRVFAVELESYGALSSGTEIRELVLPLRMTGEKLETPAGITFRTPARTGGETLLWLDAGQIEVTEGTLRKRTGGPARALEEEILLAENAEDYRFRAELPAAAGDPREMAEGRVRLVIPIEEKYLGVLAEQDLTPGGDGTLGAWLPGLLACYTGHEEDILPLLFRKSETEGIEAVSTSPLILEYVNLEAMEMKRGAVGAIRLEADYVSGEASVTGMEMAGDTFDSQEEMETVSCFLQLIDPGEERDGLLPYFDDMAPVTEWSIGWQEMMEEKPVQLELRPVREEDQVQLLFSVKKKDGTGCSVLVPYPFENRSGS